MPKRLKHQGDPSRKRVMYQLPSQQPNHSLPSVLYAYTPNSYDFLKELDFLQMALLDPDCDLADTLRLLDYGALSYRGVLKPTREQFNIDASESSAQYLYQLCIACRSSGLIQPQLSLMSNVKTLLQEYRPKHTPFEFDRVNSYFATLPRDIMEYCIRPLLITQFVQPGVLREVIIRKIRYIELGGEVYQLEIKQIMQCWHWRMYKGWEANDPPWNKCIVVKGLFSGGFAPQVVLTSDGRIIFHRAGTLLEYTPFEYRAGNIIRIDHTKIYKTRAQSDELLRNVIGTNFYFMCGGSLVRRSLYIPPYTMESDIINIVEDGNNRLYICRGAGETVYLRSTENKYYNYAEIYKRLWLEPSILYKVQNRTFVSGPNITMMYCDVCFVEA